MKFLAGLLLGIILGVAGYWYLEYKSNQNPAAEQRYKAAADQTQNSASNTASHLSDAWRAKMDALDLRSDEIKNELAQSGKVVRRKAVDIGSKVVSAAEDARIVATIKAAYAVDPNLSVWKVSVSSTDGHVTLAGTVSTTEDIGRAVALALNVDGVRDVVSNIQVKPA